MGLLSHRVERSEIVVGDHIYTWRAGFTYSHHGIYVGGNTVVHFTSGDSSLSSGSSLNLSASSWRASSTCPTFQHCGFHQPGSGVVLSCLDCFLGNGSLYRFEYGVTTSVFLIKLRGGTCTTAASEPPEEVIHKAMYLLENGFGNYDVFINNCEDFAMYCKTSLLAFDQKAQGRSGQAASVIGVPLSALLSCPLKLFNLSPVGLVTATAWMYCMNKYASDIGVRTDVIKVPVEYMALFHARKGRNNKFAKDNESCQLQIVFQESWKEMRSSETPKKLMDYQSESSVQVQNVPFHGNKEFAKKDNQSCEVQTVDSQSTITLTRTDQERSASGPPKKLMDDLAQLFEVLETSSKVPSVKEIKEQAVLLFQEVISTELADLSNIPLDQLSSCVDALLHHFNLAAEQVDELKQLKELLPTLLSDFKSAAQSIQDLGNRLAQHRELIDDIKRKKEAYGALKAIYTALEEEDRTLEAEVVVARISQRRSTIKEEAGRVTAELQKLFPESAKLRVEVEQGLVAATGWEADKNKAVMMQKESQAVWNILRGKLANLDL